MRVNTERFGDIDVTDDNILCLPSGIIGFPKLNRVLIIDHEENSPFRWLQSADDPELAFVIIDPMVLVKDYPLDKLRDSLSKGEEPPENLAVAAITTVPPAPSPITVNLVAPVVFDADKRVGAQVILSDNRFSTRHILAADDNKE